MDRMKIKKLKKVVLSNTYKRRSKPLQVFSYFQLYDNNLLCHRHLYILTQKTSTKTTLDKGHKKKSERVSFDTVAW